MRAGPLDLKKLSDVVSKEFAKKQGRANEIQR